MTNGPTHTTADKVLVGWHDKYVEIILSGFSIPRVGELQFILLRVSGWTKVERNPDPKFFFYKTVGINAQARLEDQHDA